jgi:hypothetical protein
MRSADASSSANAAAAAAKLEAALPAFLAAPPVDHFRTRCLTFANGVLQQSGHDKDAAYRILDDHCGERASGLQVPKLSAAEKARCKRYAEAWLEQRDWTGVPALEAWCQHLYENAEPHDHVALAAVTQPSPAVPSAETPTGKQSAEPVQLAARESDNANKVFFRTVYFGAANGAASLEAFLRCVHSVESTAAGSFPGFEAVQVVFDDQPGSGHFVELVGAYRSANHLSGSCTSGKCRAAVVCTAHYQMNAVPSCLCASDQGEFTPFGVGLQALQPPTCADPAPNKLLSNAGWVYESLSQPVIGC